jgi:hypothetical protein
MYDLAENSTSVRVLFQPAVSTVDTIVAKRLGIILADVVYAAKLRKSCDAHAALHDTYWTLFGITASSGYTGSVIQWNRKATEVDRRYIARYRWVVDSIYDGEYIDEPPIPIHVALDNPKLYKFMIIENSITHLINLFNIASRELGFSGDNTSRRLVATRLLFPMAEPSEVPGFDAVVGSVRIAVSGHLYAMLWLDAANISPIQTYISQIEGNIILARTRPNSRIHKAVDRDLVELGSLAPSVLYHHRIEYLAAISQFEMEHGPTAGSSSARILIDEMRVANKLTFPELLSDGDACGPVPVRNQFLVAPSGSGKSFFSTTNPNYIDADTIFEFPDVGDGEPWWNDPDLAASVDLNNAEILKEALRHDEGLVYMYADDLGLIPDAVVIVSKRVLRSNLPARGPISETGQPDINYFDDIVAKQADLLARYPDIIFDRFKTHSMQK